MLFRNRELDRAFEFIQKTEFDLFCLQEVPEPFLKRLQTLPYQIAFRIDVERRIDGQTLRIFVATLSTYPILSHGEISFPEYHSRFPLRTELFIRLMPSRFFSQIHNRGAMYVDIKVSEQVVRVFNLHLMLANPQIRKEEFELALANQQKDQATIVCGDFNILEALHITPLNWLLGGTISDILRYRRERVDMERRFETHGLHNALQDTITHPLSYSQLDHILISPSFSVQNALVVRDRMGSDHRPIRVEVLDHI